MTPPRPSPATSDEATERLRVWLRLLKFNRRVEARLRERFRAEFDTTLPRFDVMAALSRREQGLKMSELSGELRVSNGNVTGIVDRLAEDGFLVRAPVPNDRRASLVRLTRKGQEEFARQAAAHHGWIDDLLGDLSLDEARALSQRFERLLSVTPTEKD